MNHFTGNDSTGLKRGLHRKRGLQLRYRDVRRALSHAGVSWGVKCGTKGRRLLATL
jgi:hypothetical protein